MDLIRRSSPWAQLFWLLTLFFTCYVVTSALLWIIFPAISGGYTFTQINETAVWKDPSFVFAAKTMQFLFTLGAFLTPGLIFARLASPRPGAYLGLEGRSSFILVALALLIMLSALPMVGLLSEWNQLWPLPDVLAELEKDAKTQTEMILKMPDTASLVVNLVLIALAPAIAEEVLFRGVIQNLVLRMVKNGWVAVVITALFFSFIHFQFLGFMPRALLGFLLGAIYLVTGNLWLSILAHFLNNGLQVVLVFLYQAKMSNYDAMADEHVPLYFGLLSTAVTGLLIWRLHKRAQENGYTYGLADEYPDETISTTEKEY
ncbi:CPBP family intramembrane glutamic endopeptidase [Chitinophaga sp. GCM10012297]|uniref:CPBP family intramembrane metalloprotease n=1 Tax=Chitinophaga chungangae TaxID=2821488 RepID=A0ABS3YE49_9BACT|nr:type II CAAX endopeptidase family protein [Chitinophaga chungangae]MBO9152966.1 CPBP family intramembrane metalloprotease [Chitinophaga chungangae]